ncbi:MAG: helix-turn-helix domain-containing protein [Myxococcales bacterium]
MPTLETERELLVELVHLTRRLVALVEAKSSATKDQASRPNDAVEKPLVVTVDEAATLLRCGRTHVFALIRDGVVRRARRIGRRTMVFRASVVAALEEDPVRELPPRPKDERAAPTQPGDWAAIAARAKKIPLSKGDRDAIRALPLSGRLGVED